MRNTRDSSNTRPMDWLIALAESSRMAQRFFQHDARLRPGEAGDGEVLRDRREQARRGRQVVHQHPALAALQVPRETAEVGALRGVHGQVVEARGEAFPLFGGELAARHHRADVALGEGRGRRRCPARCGRGRRSVYRPAGGPPGAGDRAPAAACAGPGRRYRRRPGCRRTLEWLVYSRQAPDGVGWAWLTVCSITTRLLQRIEPSL